MLNPTPNRLNVYLFEVEVLDRNIVDILVWYCYRNGKGLGPRPSTPVPVTLIRILVRVWPMNVKFSVAGMLVGGKVDIGVRDGKVGFLNLVK
jgi:hypothetical protein